MLEGYRCQKAEILECKVSNAEMPEVIVVMMGGVIVLMQKTLILEGIDSYYIFLFGIGSSVCLGLGF